MEDFDNFESAWSLSAEEYLLLQTANYESGLLLNGKELRRAMRRYRRWRHGRFKAEIVFRSQIRATKQLLKRWVKRARV